MPRLSKPKSILNFLDNSNNPRFNPKHSLVSLPPSSSSSVSNAVTRISATSAKNADRLKTLFRRRKKIPINKKNPNMDSFVNNKSDRIARILGFTNVKSFDNFIRNINVKKLSITESKKLRRLFSYLSRVAKKNPKSIAKLAIIGGTLTAMVTYIQKFQDSYSGCFRYQRNKITNYFEESTVKYKFAGSSWCNTRGGSSSQNIILLSEKKHPLYEQKKWDCNYDNFDKSNDNNKRIIDKIVGLGCNGLCDWQNFNTLARMTKNDEYREIIISPENDIRFSSNYIYKCETKSFLHALASTTTNALGEIFTFSFGEIPIKQLVFTFLFIILMYILYKIRKMVKLNNISISSNNIQPNKG